MSNGSSNRATSLAYQHFLTEYFRRSKYDLDALVATALRTKSPTLRSVVMKGAIDPNIVPERFEELVLSGTVTEDDVADPFILGELGRLVVLQNLFPNDSVYGERLLYLAHTFGGPKHPSKRAMRVLVQHYLTFGNFDAAEGLLDAYPDLSAEYHGYLRAEMHNPFVSDFHSNAEAWLKSFNAVFHHHQLEPVDFDSNDQLRPFDRLTAPIHDHAEVVDDIPLVSVVLTAFRPDAERLWTSVRSITSQTWTNLEIIIVDDCSGPDYEEIFERIAQSDDRIRIIALPENRGTYAARNIGYAASNGQFIAGQDDDDWSHPRRIEKQIAYLDEHPEAIGCRVRAVRCHENLNRVQVGFSPEGQNASSLLIRREGYHQVGGFIEARKAADTEFYFRLMAVTGRPVREIKQPLSIIRILGGSLSRADFTPGWKHAARRSFRSAYEHWHRYGDSEEYRITEGQSVEVAVPERYQIATKTRKLHFDIIVAGDWEGCGDRQEAMLDEVRALTRHGYRVAVLNLESGRTFRVKDQHSLNDEIQELINVDSVSEVFIDDSLSADLLILRDPLVLHHLPYATSEISSEKIIIVTDESSVDIDGDRWPYVAEVCHQNAETVFGVIPTWMPTDWTVKVDLENLLSDEVIHESYWPRVVDVEHRWHNRVYYRSTTPVVGRLSNDTPLDWPKTRSSVEILYPTDGRYDVRILGSVANVLKMLGLSHPPRSWTVYDLESTAVSGFLHSLDYFVYFPESPIGEWPTKLILDVLSAGVLVILPHEMEGVIGGAALYASPKEVEQIIGFLHSDFSIYKRHANRSKKILTQCFSYESFVEALRPFTVKS